MLESHQAVLSRTLRRRDFSQRKDSIPTAMTRTLRMILLLIVVAASMTSARAESKKASARATPILLVEDYQVLQRGDDDTATVVIRLSEKVEDGAPFKVVAWEETGASATRLD